MLLKKVSGGLTRLALCYREQLGHALVQLGNLIDELTDLSALLGVLLSLQRELVL